ncbi:LacI family DNA-binding transcriptional regulator [Demequina sp.]|uniref:LacI family DNA-binding transcriptional regulator n=1 Tax=Demequina sp. TaxID=2050685 RepID=UPI0025F2D964|nr:LacI family DNA-binding transcriptional regulator [Demequina sp.]
MDDVARAAGVSKAAVSKVIRHAYGVSPEMRDRVERTIAELEYRPRVAARVMRGQSFTIGVEIPNLGNEFFTEVMAGASSKLRGSPYQMIIAPGLGDGRGAQVLESLSDRQVDGMIAISPGVSSEWLERLGEEIPMVMLGRHDRAISYDTLTNDDALGAELAVSHLIERGHQRIAHLTISSDEESWPRTPHGIRHRAYIDTLEARGLTPVVSTCEYSSASAYAAGRELIASGQITAIFVGNDALAIEVLRALADLDLTTDSVAVVGYDDIPLASHPRISLTTVSQFGRHMGALAIELLLERIVGGRTDSRHEVVTPELRMRASSAAPAPLLN